MERVVHKAKNFKEAEEWDILQQINLTPEQRQEIARQLKQRFYGSNTVDVRESGKVSKKKMTKSED